MDELKEQGLKKLARDGVDVDGQLDQRGEDFLVDLVEGSLFTY
jgi:hypothetical protein